MNVSPEICVTLHFSWNSCDIINNNSLNSNSLDDSPIGITAGRFILVLEHKEVQDVLNYYNIVVLTKLVECFEIARRLKRIPYRSLSISMKLGN